MDVDTGRRMSMDARMIREIERSSSMRGEQGSDWLSEYGGPSAYRYWARQPLSDRLTFFAIQSGYDTPQDIAAVTDLRVSDVNRSLDKLRAKKLVEVGQVVK